MGDFSTPNFVSVDENFCDKKKISNKLKLRRVAPLLLYPCHDANGMINAGKPMGSFFWGGDLFLGFFLVFLGL